MKFTNVEFLYLMSAIIVGLLIAWLGLMYFVSRHKDALNTLFSDGNLLRMVTVVFIIAAASCLALIDKLSSELATLFSGVAGYVLGSMKAPEKAPATNSSTLQTGGDSEA